MIPYLDGRYLPCHDLYRPECPQCVHHDETCGTRCDTCNERMCTWYGPEPAITCAGHDYCTDCDQTNNCIWCKDARTAE